MAVILGIIPARGGSKGIPHKNIAPLGGVPLIAHTINAARGCPVLTDIIVSTDDADISACVRELGVNVDSLRPADLALDTTPTIDVVRYEILNYEKKTGSVVDAVVLLQPTSPLRRATDISGAWDAFIKSGSDSLISVYSAENVHPSIMYRTRGDCLVPFMSGDNTQKRRQDMEPVFVRNGAIYIFIRDLAVDRGRLIGDAPAAFIMPRARSVNIDNPEDLYIAEYLLGAGEVGHKCAS